MAVGGIGVDVAVFVGVYVHVGVAVGVSVYVGVAEGSGVALGATVGVGAVGLLSCAHMVFTTNALNRQTERMTRTCRDDLLRHMIADFFLIAAFAGQIVIDDVSVFEQDHAIRVLRDARIVGDHDHCFLLFVT